MDVQQKIKATDDKISHFQGLEEKVERLTKILEALLGADSLEAMEATAFSAPQQLSTLLNKLPVPPPQRPQHILPSSQLPPRLPPPPPPPSKPTPSATTTANGTLKSPPRVANTALSLLTAKATEGDKSLIFDEWKVVGKKGKRNAEASNIGEQKQPDQKETPT
jgi:hypothetical protein